MAGTDPVDETSIIRILHVDDDVGHLEMTKYNLESANPSFKVSSVASASEALDALSSGEYDCVVSDYQMHEMNGIELCVEIRKKSDVPLIIYTGRGNEEVASKAFAAGVDDYVRKERDVAHYQLVSRRVMHAVEKRRAGQKLRESEDRSSKAFHNMQAAEQRNRELLDSISDGFFALDREWRFTYVNEPAANNLGYKPTDLIGKNTWKLFPSILGTDQEAHYRAAMDKGEKRRFRIKDASTESSYDVAVYPSPEGISVLWSDITYQRVGEDELARRTDLRRSGVELIGDVPWGTHFCQFYNTKTDLLDTLVPYFKAGLEGNEFCMWVTAEPLLENAAKKAMKKTIPGFSKYVESGQIEIISYKDWYLKDGGFNSDRVLQGWVDKLEAALKACFSGIRLTVNTFCLEKEQCDAFTSYEEAVNKVLGRYKMVALCTYCLDKCNANEIVDVVKNHQFALIKRDGKWVLIESGEHRKAEAALKVSEERYRKIVETAQEGIAICSPDGAFTLVNKCFADMLGYSRDDLIGKSVLDFMPEDEKNKALISERYPGKDVSSQVEYRFTRGDGSTLWTLASSSPLYDADGRHIGDLTMHSEITQRKRDEHALLQAKLEWERTFDHVPDLISVLDSNHHITRANKAFSDTLGMSPEKCVGLTCYECVHGRDAPPEFCPHSKTLVDGYEHTAEVYEPRLGGYFVVSTTPLKEDEGRVVGSVHVARNITERKLAEEMIAKANEELRVTNEGLEEKTVEIEALNDELLASNEELRETNEALKFSEEELASTVEELRTANEQLMSSEEELAASNEDLRVSNDELHESYTELAVANEELSAAREKIQGYAEQLEKLVDERTHEIKVVSERLEAFINSATAGFSLWDSDLNLVDANRAWLGRLPGNPSKESLLGRSMTEIYPGVQATGVYQKYKEVLRTGLPYETELSPRHPSFPKRFYSITAFKVGDGLGIISRDITERKQLYDELERASVYNRNLIEASLDPLVTISAGGKITDVNEATERVTGLSRDQLIGSDFSDYFTDPEEARKGYQRVFAEGSVRDYPLAIRHASGKVTDVLYHATVYRNEAGEVQGVFAAARDITEKKRLEEEARLTQERLKAFMDSATNGFSIWDSELRLLDANEAWLSRRPKGTKKADFIGRKMTELFQGVEKLPRYKEYLKVLETGEPFSFEDTLAGYPKTNRIFSGYVFRVGTGLGMTTTDITEAKEMEERLQLFIESVTDPFVIWDHDLNLVNANEAMLSWFPAGTRKSDIIGKNIRELVPDAEKGERYTAFQRVLESGEPVYLENLPSLTGRGDRIYDVKIFRLREGIGVINYDITERKNAEEKLRESSLYTRNLIEASLDPLVTISPEGKIMDVNRATEEVTGVHREKLIGSEFSDYFTDPKEAKRGYQKVLKEGSVRDYPLAIRHSDGRVADVLYNAAVYRNQAGKVQGVFAAARDVTYQKRLEESLREAQQYETAERLSALVAHDIRNPLNTANQALQMARSEPSRADHMLDLAEKSLSRAVNMIEDLRENSRLIKPNKVPVNLPALVEETVKDMPLHEDVVYEREFRDNLNPVWIDPALIRRVLENLVSNALEAMPEGGSLRICGRREGEEALISVADSGVGIHEDAAQNIFKHLYTTKSKGIGLGLSFCKRAVEAHNGTIGFSSKVGKGTTFTVRLPAR